MGIDDHFTHLDKVVMKTFGHEYTWTSRNGVANAILGVLVRDVQPTGLHDAVMQSRTEITVSNIHKLQRNDRISTPLETWRVDRKLKDDGSLAKWSLHADRS